MILTTQNNRLYDSRNFDLYKNVYAVYVDKEKLEYNRKIYQDEYEKLHINYVKERFELLLFFNKLSDIKDFQNGYQIIYGHFYNKEDLFLYKNTRNGEIFGYKIKKCLRDKLYFNKDRTLLCSNSYRTLANQVKLINTKENNEHTSNLKPLELNYNYFDETLNFIDLGEIYTEITYISEDDKLLMIPIITQTVINLN